MNDRKNVIKGLELLYDRLLDAAKRDSIALLDASMVADAIALLKEQEPVEPAMDEDTTGHWVILENCSNAGVYCSECNTRIFDHYPMKKKFSYFCQHCGTRMEGQVVKW